MFIEEKLLRRILRIIDRETGKSNHKLNLYYYPASGLISSLSNAELGKEFPLKFNDKIWGKRKVNIHVSKELIIKPVLNGFIVVDLDRGIIYKFVDRKFEPNFLQNEKKAAVLIPNYVPKLNGVGMSGDFDYIVQQYISKYKWVVFGSWEEMLQDIKIPIKELHTKQKNRVKKIKADTYINSLMKEARVVESKHKLLKDIFKRNIELYDQVLDGYDLSDLDCFKAFQHGDLTPNNVIKTKDKIYLFDFQNGGELNIFYDLMIQDFYAPNSDVWRNFNRLRLDRTGDQKIFKGWTDYYFRLLKDTHQIKINDRLVKISLLISLLEICLKNFLRYQYKEGIKEGLVIQNIVRQIGLNILKS